MPPNDFVVTDVL